jgi:hypothetical protein
MRRREFIAVLGGAAAWPLAARAQATRVPRVGILFVGSLDADRHQGFVTAMQQLGYREGATINYELRNTAVDQLPGVVRDLIALMRYRASKFDCDACGLKQRCTPNMPARKILRSIHEGRARSRSRSGADRRLSHVTPRAEEGRDAVRPPQAHPEAGPPTPAGPERCQGRVPPRRHRPKPPQARQADSDPAAGARLRGAALARPNVATRLEAPKSRLLQHNLPKADVCRLRWAGAHSITSSARARTAGGIVRASVAAAFRLITSSNLVGCSTGNSSGRAPFRILSALVASWR